MQDKSLGERKLNSGILGASVANLSIAGLQDNVIIHLKNTEPVPVSPSSYYKIEISHKENFKRSHCSQIRIRDHKWNNFFALKLQANFVAKCVFWDFTLNGKIFVCFF